MARAQRGIGERYALYKHMAEPFDHGTPVTPPSAPTPDPKP